MFDSQKNKIDSLKSLTYHQLSYSPVDFVSLAVTVIKPHQNVLNFITVMLHLAVFRIVKEEFYFLKFLLREFLLKTSPSFLFN